MGLVIFFILTIFTLIWIIPLSYKSGVTLWYYSKNFWEKFGIILFFGYAYLGLAVSIERLYNFLINF